MKKKITKSRTKSHIATEQAKAKRLLLNVLKQLEANKELYAALDSLTEFLLDTGFEGDAKIKMIDNFADGNVKWKGTAIRRIEYKLK